MEDWLQNTHRSAHRHLGYFFGNVNQNQKAIIRRIGENGGRCKEESESVLNSENANAMLSAKPWEGKK